MPIAKAIRHYLRHSYAAWKLGIVTDVPPLRLSTYTGKGEFATGLDGRADWTAEFYRHMERAERRTPRDVFIRFGCDEIARAMEALAQHYPKWHTIVTALDVYGVRVEDYVLETGTAILTVKRQRKKAYFFLYQTLRLNAHYTRMPVDFVTFREI